MMIGVSPPWYRDDPVEWTAFNLYIMECEEEDESPEEENEE